MFDDFENVKKQLLELAKVINSFNSESVQIRILELIFEREEIRQSELTGKPKKRKKKAKAEEGKKTNKNAKIEGAEKGPKKTTKKKRIGGQAMLAILIDEGYFNDRRSVKDIIEYCKHNKATSYRSNDFSGRLSRLLRKGVFERDKNEDNQYEYWKK